MKEKTIINLVAIEMPERFCACINNQTVNNQSALHLQMVHVIPTLAMRLIAPIFLRPFFFTLSALGIRDRQMNL